MGRAREDALDEVREKVMCRVARRRRPDEGMNVELGVVLLQIVNESLAVTHDQLLGRVHDVLASPVTDLEHVLGHGLSFSFASEPRSLIDQDHDHARGARGDGPHDEQ